MVPFWGVENEKLEFCHRKHIVESRGCARSTARVESCRLRILPTTSCGPYPPQPDREPGRAEGQQHHASNIMDHL